MFATGCKVPAYPVVGSCPIFPITSSKNREEIILIILGLTFKFRDFLDLDNSRIQKRDWADQCVASKWHLIVYKWPILLGKFAFNELEIGWYVS